MSSFSLFEKAFEWSMRYEALAAWIVEVEYAEGPLPYANKLLELTFELAEEAWLAFTEEEVVH